MSDKEKVLNIIDGLSESQIKALLQMLTGYTALNAELEDDMYCAELYDEYSNGSDEDKADNIAIEDFASELGIAL
jgi:hypothetical protein